MLKEMNMGFLSANSDSKPISIIEMDIENYNRYIKENGSKKYMGVDIIISKNKGIKFIV